MGAHEDLPFTGWGADRPEDYAPPAGHRRPGAAVIDPHEGWPRGCPCVTCHATGCVLAALKTLTNYPVSEVWP